jgi:hypothetical protein
MPYAMCCYLCAILIKVGHSHLVGGCVMAVALVPWASMMMKYAFKLLHIINS